MFDLGSSNEDKPGTFCSRTPRISCVKGSHTRNAPRHLWEVKRCVPARNPVVLGAAQAARQADYYLIYRLTLPPCARPRGERGLESASIRSGCPLPQPQSPHRPLLLLLPSFLLQDQTARPFRHEDVLLALHKPRTAPGARPTAGGRTAQTPAEPSAGARPARGRQPLRAAVDPAQAKPDPQNGCSLHSLLKFILNAVLQDHF